MLFPHCLSADVVFNSAGRFVVRDQGVITIFMRVVTKVNKTQCNHQQSDRQPTIHWFHFLLSFQIIDAVLLAEIVNRVAHTSADFSALDKRKKKTN